MNENLDWWPDWLPETWKPRSSGIQRDIESDNRTEYEDYQLGNTTQHLVPPPSSSDPSSVSSDSGTSTIENGTTDSESIHEIQETAPIRIYDAPPAWKTVNRKLRGIHLFMITINAVFGSGLYLRGGQILEVGGPLAVVLAFLLVGILSWAVMQCISELLCIWPVPGALPMYVSEFVDPELGVAVGVAYWFQYAMCYATLLPSAATELGFWPGISHNKAILGGVVYFSIPVFLVLMNMLKIEIYGFLEVVTGSIKMLFLLIIIVVLIAINRGVGMPGDEPIGTIHWQHPLDYDHKAANNWFTALLMCISISSFAYTGVEVIAASALEAKYPHQYQGDGMHRRKSTNPSQTRLHIMDNTIKFSAIYIPVIVTIGYTVCGLLATLDIPRTQCGLITPTWLSNDHLPNCNSTNSTRSQAPVVIIAELSNIPHLPDIFNFFLVFTCLTAASTNLYIASRSLFGLASRLAGGKSRRRLHLKVFTWFGRTNRNKVPLRALLFSAVAFGWIPFLQLTGDDNSTDSVNQFVEVMSTMASVSTLIVWACECLAFIRFYHCIYRHRDHIEEEDIPLVQRWNDDKPFEYPYKSHWQPYLGYVERLSFTIILIILSNCEKTDSTPEFEDFKY
ncbi:proline-specific permease [Penicillium herquei]|nr:proline-specific permease [Penicillium herquei]